MKEYEAKHAKELEAKHAKEHEEQESREAAARAAEAAARKQREEQEQDKGGVSLTATSVTVQRNGMALVKLECLGIASCHGKLMLTVKDAVKEKGVKGEGEGPRRPARSRSGPWDRGLSIAGDETKAVKVNLNAAGRACWSGSRAFSASLEILELAPGAKNTQTKTVQLLQRQGHDGFALVLGPESLQRHRREPVAEGE